MEGFSISVDLSSFFSDFRAKSLVYVDTSTMKTIAHVENRIKSLFDINVDICLFSDLHFLPTKEDARVLRICDSIKIAPADDRNANTNREHFDQNGAQLFRGRRRERNSDVDICIVDTEQCQDILPLTKKKKHKKRRICNEDGDNHDMYTDCSSGVVHNSPPSSLSESFSGGVEAKKKKRSKQSSSSITSISEIAQEDSENASQKSTTAELRVSLSRMSDTTISSFHNRECSKQAFESPSLKKKKSNHVVEADMNCDNLSFEKSMNSVSETANQIMPPEDDENSVAETLEEMRPQKRKRKRTRPRKSSQKAETPAVPVELQTPELPKKLQPEHYCPQPSAKNTKHIYFSDETLLTCEHAIEKEVHDNTAGETAVEETVEHGSDEASVEKVSGKETVKKVSSEETVEKASAKESLEKTNSEEIVTAPSESTQDEKTCEEATERMTPEPSSSGDSPVPKKDVYLGPRRRRNSKASAGIGKLLSLLKSGSPAVFERQRLAAKSASLPDQTVRTNSTPTTCDKPHQSFPSTLNPVSSAKCSPSPSFKTAENVAAVKFVPRKNSVISFKILKMSPSYCPEMSRIIVAVVENVVHESEHVTLRLISGAHECLEPKGKFDLDEDELTNDVPPKTIQLKWGELIEPVECP